MNMVRSMHCTAKRGTVLKLRVGSKYYMNVRTFSIKECNGDAVLSVNGLPMHNPNGFLLDIEIHGSVENLLVNEGLVTVHGKVDTINTGAELKII